MLSSCMPFNIIYYITGLTPSVQALVIDSQYDCHACTGVCINIAIMVEGRAIDINKEKPPFYLQARGR